MIVWSHSNEHWSHSHTSKCGDSNFNLIETKRNKINARLSIKSRHANNLMFDWIYSLKENAMQLKYWNCEFDRFQSTRSLSQWHSTFAWLRREMFDLSLTFQTVYLQGKGFHREKQSQSIVRIKFNDSNRMRLKPFSVNRKLLMEIIHFWKQKQWLKLNWIPQIE